MFSRSFSKNKNSLTIKHHKNILEVEGKRTTSLKVILSHFHLSATSFFLQAHLIHDAPDKIRCLQSPLYTFLRIRNRAKIQDTNFVQKSFNPNARFLILFIFSFFIFFSFFFLNFFGFFLFLFFDFFWIFSFLFFGFFFTTSRGCPHLHHTRVSS